MKCWLREKKQLGFQSSEFFTAGPLEALVQTQHSHSHLSYHSHAPSPHPTRVPSITPPARVWTPHALSWLCFHPHFHILIPFTSQTLHTSHSDLMLLGWGGAWVTIPGPKMYLYSYPSWHSFCKPARTQWLCLPGCFSLLWRWGGRGGFTHQIWATT